MHRLTPWYHPALCSPQTQHNYMMTCPFLLFFLSSFSPPLPSASIFSVSSVPLASFTPYLVLCFSCLTSFSCFNSFSSCVSLLSSVSWFSLLLPWKLFFRILLVGRHGWHPNSSWDLLNTDSSSQKTPVFRSLFWTCLGEPDFGVTDFSRCAVRMAIVGAVRRTQVPPPLAHIATTPNRRVRRRS